MVMTSRRFLNSGVLLSNPASLNALKVRSFAPSDQPWIHLSSNTKTRKGYILTELSPPSQWELLIAKHPLGNIVEVFLQAILASLWGIRPWSVLVLCYKRVLDHRSGLFHWIELLSMLSRHLERSATPRSVLAVQVAVSSILASPNWD